MVGKPALLALGSCLLQVWGVLQDSGRGEFRGKATQVGTDQDPGQEEPGPSNWLPRTQPWRGLGQVFPHRLACSCAHTCACRPYCPWLQNLCLRGQTPPTTFCAVSVLAPEGSGWLSCGYIPYPTPASSQSLPFSADNGQGGRARGQLGCTGQGRQERQVSQGTSPGYEVGFLGLRPTAPQP